MTVHKTVLLQETIDSLNLKNGAIAVDATLGGGGHSLAMLKKILPEGKLVAIDQDEEAIERFEKKIASSKIKPKGENIQLVHRNFADLKDILLAAGISEAGAIVADLGISSDQLDAGKRGFSFQKDEKLDMRMGKSLRTENNQRTAEFIVNNYSEDDLHDVIKKYGEEKFARRIAKGIIESRQKKAIKTTLELAEIIEQSVPAQYRRGRINPATKTFQALRIEVNNELENLEKFLIQGIEALKVGGRLAIISFHSGEDSIVKNIFRENARGCICPPATQLQWLQEDYIKAVETGSPEVDKLEKALRAGPPSFPLCRCGKVSLIKIINSRPIVAGDAELKANPRSRSAKLRIVEKI